MTYTIYLFDHLFLLTIHVGLKSYVESIISIEISFLTWRLLSTRNPTKDNLTWRSISNYDFLLSLGGGCK